MAVVEPVPNGVRLHVVVQPRASRSEVVGIHGDRLKLRLAAPPVDDAANDELVSFLAKLLSVSRASVSITAGFTGRRKTVVVVGVSERAVRDQGLGGKR